MPEPEPVADPLVGSVLDEAFEIEELIGEGAMGRVYAARQRSLDTMVAVKPLHAQLANDP